PTPMRAALREVFHEAPVLASEQFLGISAVPSAEDFAATQADPPVAKRSQASPSYLAPKTAALVPDAQSYVAKGASRSQAAGIVVVGSDPMPPAPPRAAAAPKAVANVPPPASSVVAALAAARPMAPGRLPDAAPPAVAARSGELAPGSREPIAERMAKAGHEPDPAATPMAPKIPAAAPARTARIDAPAKGQAADTVASNLDAYVAMLAQQMEMPVPPPTPVLVAASPAAQLAPPVAASEKAIVVSANSMPEQALQIRLGTAPARAAASGATFDLEAAVAALADGGMPSLKGGHGDEVVIVVAHGMDPAPLSESARLDAAGKPPALEDDVRVASTQSTPDLDDISLVADGSDGAGVDYVVSMDQDSDDASFALAKVPQLPLWTVMDAGSNLFVP
ncbi:MAG: hypothetical protein Q7U14_02540, partial [Lacisediminimonas sp.]|nr:hypothetical protein [Lacisediminimonas sp.]